MNSNCSTSSFEGTGKMLRRKFAMQKSLWPGWWWFGCRRDLVVVELIVRLREGPPPRLG
jgi:hypothetical protein